MQSEPRPEAGLQGAADRLRDPLHDPSDASVFEDALRVARMYYDLELTTAQIAAQLGVSRTKVSRLLAWAKERGLIETRVIDHRSHQLALEERLEDAFQIEDVKVVPVQETASDDHALQAVTQYAAHHLNRLVRPNMTVALAWGNTISVLARALVPKPVPGMQIVQMNGSGNSGTGATYAADIVMRFASNFRATPHLLPIPAYFDDPATKLAMYRERSIARVRDLAREADIALFSIGVPDADSYVYQAGYVERTELDALRADGVVGDIATVFFRGDGTYRDVAMNDRSCGPSLAEVADHKHSICIVTGRRKREAVLGALRGKFMNTLVIDERVARTLL